MDYAALKSELTRDEARKPRLYQDTLGNWTGGIGHNFTAKPLSDRVIDLLYEEDSNAAVADLDRSLPWWRTLSEARQRVLANMCFNMGIGTLLEFKNTLKAIQEQRWSDAAQGMLNSKWAGQVGDRAHRLAKMMEQG